MLRSNNILVLLRLSDVDRLRLHLRVWRRLLLLILLLNVLVAHIELWLMLLRLRIDEIWPMKFVIHLRLLWLLHKRGTADLNSITHKRRRCWQFRTNSGAVVAVTVDQE